PHTRLPLHVFEPRYRQMVKDALETDQRFGIVLLRPGWETDYFGAPTVFECGTVGTIEQAVPLEDGRFNIVVRGDVRFRILEEVSRVPYRTARVTAVPEIETVSLDALTNALIMSLNLDVEEKQRLLELSDVMTRAEEIGSELT